METALALDKAFQAVLTQAEEECMQAALPSPVFHNGGDHRAAKAHTSGFAEDTQTDNVRVLEYRELVAQRDATISELNGEVNKYKSALHNASLRNKKLYEILAQAESELR